MAKDPAFLFYPNDWLGGTMGMSFDSKGAYIELLVLQFNKEKFTEQQAINFIGKERWTDLKEKFQTDGTFFWNKRLLVETDKRKAYGESRRRNISKRYVGTHEPTHEPTHEEPYVLHKENENENENKIENRKLKFISSLETFLEKYPLDLIKEFGEYWTEHNEGGKKMRFEMQKVFDISRRLATWERNNKKFNFKKNGKQITDTDLAEALKRSYADKQ